MSDRSFTTKEFEINESGNNPAIPSIYGDFQPVLEDVAALLLGRIVSYSRDSKKEQNSKPYEHLSYRIKSEESMRAKCAKLGLDATTANALSSIRDAIGVRVVCLFIDDIYENIEQIRHFKGCKVVDEKDYILQSKPNGYRSYHLILNVTELLNELVLPEGSFRPECLYAEIQLRTIAMDTWAALEHEMKYKKDIPHPELISQELKRCADELASCDVSMQTLRDLIRGS